MALTSRTTAPVGDFTPRVCTDYEQGDTLNWQGVQSATEDLVIDDQVGKINLTTAAGGVNDFDLPAGAHGQEILVTLETKNTDNATLTEDSGVEVRQRDNAAFVSATFDAEGEYVLLRYEYDHWVIVTATATIAAV